jgi:DNA-binding MarR family transcriptional regulator
MDDARHKGQKKTGPTLPERLLRLEGDIRRILEPIRVTPSQGGVSLATLSRTVTALVRKRWVTRRRSVTNTRGVHLLLSRWGNALALQTEQRVRQVNATLAEQDRRSLGMIPKGSRT